MAQPVTEHESEEWKAYVKKDMPATSDNTYETGDKVKLSAKKAGKTAMAVFLIADLRGPPGRLRWEYKLNKQDGTPHGGGWFAEEDLHFCK